MMRWTLVALLMAACTPKKTDSPEPAAAAPEATTTEPAETRAKPSSAPATVTAEIGETESRVDVTFPTPGKAITVEIWGATGLTIAAEKRVWAGDVTDASTMSFTVQHTGDGDLAVRIEGEFGGRRTDKVQSFTVGDRRPTEVPTTPVEGDKPIKGWDATPK